VELLDPPKTVPVTGDVVRCRGTDPVVALLTFHADVLPDEEAEAARGAEGGTGRGPAGKPPSEDMGGEQVLDWEAEREQRRVNAHKQNHEGELDVFLEIREKPPTPLEHTCDRVPWRPSYPLPQRGAVYVRNFLTEVDKSRREGGVLTMRAMQRERASCPKGPTGDKGCGPTSTSSSVRAFYAIWGGNGWQRTATFPTKKPGNRGSQRTRGPTG
jgi:hypothetical protein